MLFIKNFVDWIKLKIQLDGNQRFPKFEEGDIWWCHLGENVGYEQNGKNKNSCVLS